MGHTTARRSGTAVAVPAAPPPEQRVSRGKSKEAGAAPNGVMAAPPPVDTEVEVVPLLRRVVRHAEGCCEPPPPGFERQPNEVLLDFEVDGTRYLLLRSASKAADHMVLSPREHEISRMVAKGYPNKTIASVLEISLWTVGTYLRRIFAKLNVTSRAAMVARLMETGRLEETNGSPAAAAAHAGRGLMGRPGREFVPLGA